MAKGPKYKWPIDESLLENKYGGKNAIKNPPVGHPGRCQGRVRRSVPPRQCGQWSAQGARFCRYHGGEKRKLLTYKSRHVGFYSSKVGGSLRAKLEELEQLDPERRMSLAAEIDLTRVVALRHLEIYDKVVLGPRSDECSPELKAAASSALRGSLSEIANLVQTSARVKALSGGVLSYELLDFVLAQVVVALNDVLGDDKATIDALEKRIREIKLPAEHVNAQELKDSVRRALASMDTSVLGEEPKEGGSS